MATEVKKIDVETKDHDKIMEALTRRRIQSNQAMRKYDQRWEKDEDNFFAYIPEVEAKKAASLNKSLDSYTPIVVPYSYAMVMSAATFVFQAFLGRSPVYQFVGRHGESEDNRNAVESIMEYQRMKGNHTPNLYGWVVDTFKRGVGIIGYDWVEDYGIVRKLESGNNWLGDLFIGKWKRDESERILEYSGTKLYNVRPQNCYFDPRKSMIEFQEGEYFGVQLEMSWNAIVRGYDNGMYFNLKALETLALETSRYDSMRYGSGSVANELPRDGLDAAYTGINPGLDLKSFRVVKWYVELIPKEWGLGSSKSPEKWLFMVANDQVIFHARPLGEYHNKYPFAVMVADIDPHQLFNPSLTALTAPIQSVMTWLWNSHMFNVEKAVNDMFIVDPSLVHLKSLQDPKPGKIITIAPGGFGTDVRRAITQFGVTDVTQNHMGDLLQVGEFARWMTGINQNIMGDMQSGGRKTATETRVAGSYGAGRLRAIAEYMGSFGFAPLITMMLQTTQQNYDIERQFRLAGDTALSMGSAPLIAVNPENIAGSYDFVPFDGNVEIDKFATANLWRELIQIGSGNPAIAPHFNWADIFSWIAQLGGLTNINRFKMQVVPDDIAAQQRQNGDLLSLDEVLRNAGISGAGMGGAGSQGPGVAGGNGAGLAGGVPGPGQVEGLGDFI